MAKTAHLAVAQGLTAVTDAVTDLELLHPRLVEQEKLAASSFDGYRRRSISEHNGVTNETEPLLDEHGEPLLDPATHRPIMVPVPQRSDPVAQTVISRSEQPYRSEEAAVRRKVDRLIEDARRALDAAVRIARAALDGRPDPPENADGVWCTSHLRVTPTPMHEPVDPRVPRKGLCRDCYTWDLAYRRMVRENRLPNGWPALPPTRLLAALGRGENQTSKVLHDHLDGLVGAQAVDQYLAWCRATPIRETVR